jgi:hypothetical protein
MTQTISAYDNLGLRQINLGSGVAAADAVNKAQLDAATRAAGVGTLRALRPAVSWGRDSATSTIQHTAFPSVVQLRNGSLYMVIRRASNHSAARDGGIWYSRSTDLGRSWTAPVQLYAATSVEYRDPCVSLSADGTKIYLTYFRASTAAPAAGCFFRASTDGGTTWSAETRFDGSKPYAACSAPIVELANGRLVAPFYGKDNAGDTYDSVYVSISSNAGATWTPLKIYNGADVSQHLQEPWISRKPDANDMMMTFRFGTNNNIGFGSTVQADGLGWSAAVVAFSGTGRPSTVWLSTGEIIATYRDSTGQLMWSRFYINGSWYPPTLVRRTPAGGFWTYAHPIEVGPGTALCPFTEEPSGAAISKLYTTALNRGGGWSPVGQIPPDAVAAATSYDYIEYVTTFRERPGTTLGSEWTTLSGALAINDTGYLSSAAADNTPDRAMVDVNNPNVVIEADFYMTVQTGAAILTRVVDANNFLMFTVETTGTVGRLYKVVAGVATQLAFGNVNTALGSWNTLRVEATDTLLRAYINGTVVAGYILAAGTEASTFTTPTKHGVGLNAQSGGAHLCRRYVIFSR